MSNTTLQKHENHQGFIDSILSFVSNLRTRFTVVEETEEDQLLKMLREAHSQWKSAELYFQAVTEPDLIDHAIYEMDAAQTKYRYLLKQARENGLKGEYMKQSL